MTIINARQMLTLAGAAMLAVASNPAMAQAADGAEPVNIAQSAKWHNEQALALASRLSSDGWGWLEGGLMWRKIKGDNTAARPSIRDTVTVHYTGSFTNGEVFDSSVERGQPATFPLSNLIPAWQIAIPLMSIGDTFEIAVPAPLAYGTRAGRGPIPSGATLLFTIELIAIPSQ